MLAMLNPKFWLAAIVAALLGVSHIFVYRAGVNSTKVATLVNNADVNREARKMENLREQNVTGALNAKTLRNRQQVLANSALSDQLNSVLDTQRSVSSSLSSNANDACGPDCEARKELLRTVEARIERLARRGAEIAKDADSWQSDTQTLEESYPK